jgi:hypothetical protein
MSNMSIKTFLNVAEVLPVESSVLLRGPHGIGKSQVVRQVAKAFNLPVIDRRLSQMTEGDMVGLPSTDGEVTRFNPPDWFKRACTNPVCLFLDEINRATPEVMQAAFQIVLDRWLNGWTLHSETRVFAAVNNSAAYTVNEMDPALLDRFWTIDLEPTVEDWLTWARSEDATGATRVYSVVSDFIAGNEKWLDSPKDAEPGKVSPSRRSWERLSGALAKAGITQLDEPANHPLFYPVCLGYIGTEATIAFNGFAKTIDSQVSGQEILSDYSKVKRKVKKLGAEKQNILIDKVTAYITKELKSLDDKQGQNLRSFMNDLPGEHRVSCWSKLTQGSGTENLELAKSIHKWCVEGILESFGVSADAAVKALSTQATKKKAEK